MNLASLASQKICAAPLGNTAQPGLGWAEPSQGWGGPGRGMRDVFSVGDAQTCGSCRRLKTFNRHKKVKALTTLRDVLPWFGWICRQVHWDVHAVGLGDGCPTSVGQY